MSLALFEERIEHTSWTITIRLVLLLRPNVDTPPYWSSNSHIFIENVLNDPVSTISRVSLDIDCLDGSVESNILESNISNASMEVIRWDRSYCHSHTVGDLAVNNSDVLGASWHLVGLVCWFDSYSIVKVSNGHVFDVDVGA